MAGFSSPTARRARDAVNGDKLVQSLLVDLGRSLSTGQRQIREDLSNLMLGQRELMRNLQDLGKAPNAEFINCWDVNSPASPASPEELRRLAEHGVARTPSPVLMAGTKSSPKSISVAPSIRSVARTALGPLTPVSENNTDGLKHRMGLMTQMASKSSAYTEDNDVSRMDHFRSFNPREPDDQYWRQASELKYSSGSNQSSAGGGIIYDGGAIGKDVDMAFVGSPATSKDLGLLHSDTDNFLIPKRALPDKWPTSVTLRYGFGTEANEEAGNRDTERKLSAAISASSGNVLDLQFANHSVRRTWSAALKERYMAVTLKKAMNPQSAPVVIRDVTGVIFLMLELVVNPFVLAWDVAVEGWLLSFAFLVAVFWSTEMTTSFLTGYHLRGETRNSQPEAAMHYMRTGFLVDICLVAIDWTNVILSSLGKVGSELRIIKVFRFLKVVRVARLFSLIGKIPIWRVPLVAAAAQHMIFVKLVIGTLLGNHILACGWHFMGQEGQTDTERLWGRDVPMHDCLEPTTCERHPIGDFPVLYQYVTALHWTVAQMTLGASDVTPVNSGERIYNIVLLLLGLVVGSTCVSLVSAEIIKYTVTKRDQAILMETLWRYMSQNTIHPRLRVRIMGQVNERLVERLAQLSEEDVQALGLLSVSLRQELCYATRLPHLRLHPLFQMWISIETEAIHQLCECALQFEFMSPQDELFLCGMEADDCHILLRGTLSYTQVPGKSMVAEEVTKRCTEGTWISEAALWSNWLHVGDALADTSCQLLAISAPRLVSLLERYAGTGSHIRALTLVYGRNYHVRIVASEPPHADFPTDLQVPFTDPSDLFSRHVSIGILRRAEKHGSVKLNNDQRKLLEGEVAKEKCAIRATGHGYGIERIVCVTALRIRDDKDRVLHALAEWNHQVSLKVDCKLPGTKRANGELPGKSLQRITDEEFRPLADKLEYHGTKLDVNTKESEQYGVRTAYYRTIYDATLKEPWEELGLCTARVCLTDSNDTPPELVKALMQPMLMLQSKRGNTLYAWLSDEEVKLLTATEAKRRSIELISHESLCL